MHDLYIAYELLLDNKKNKQHINDIYSAQSTGNSGGVSGSGGGGLGSGGGLRSPVKLKGLSDPVTPPRSGSGGIGSSGGKEIPSRLPDGTRRRRWYLGIQSKKDPAHVMTEVYKAILDLGKCESECYQWTE